MAGPVLLHSASFERTVTMMLGLIACLYLFATVVSTHFQLDPTSSIDTHGRHGGVVSGSAPCSDIGINVLRKGGNAADAMVATQFCLGVTVMYLTGIGGGGFALIRAANGSSKVVDFRETAPAAAFPDMYKNDLNASIYGGLASGVPGEVRGLQTIHAEYGSLDWASLVLPAAELARCGFQVTPDLVRAMDNLGPDSMLTTDPNWAQDFAPNGTRVGIGDTLTRKRYGDLLATIALEGADAFYNGAIADMTVRALRNANGSMTLQDLEDYAIVFRDPVSIDYRGYKISSCGTPAGGSVVLSAMNTVEGYTDLGLRSSINLSTYRLDQAMRFAYGERTKLGDPELVDGMEEYESRILSAAASAEIRSKITDSHTLPVSSYNPDGLEILETPGTSHVVTADASGLALSLTSTVNLNFGSQLLVPETGLIMNNEMNDFSVPNVSNAFGYSPSPANFIRPGKRPLSSMSPTIVEYLENSTFHLATGAAGGSRIITSTIQSLWRTLDLKENLEQAIASPRFHDQLSPDEVKFEYTYDNDTTAFLAARGLNISWVPVGSLTFVQSLMLTSNGTFVATAEPRQKGSGGYTL